MSKTRKSRKTLKKAEAIDRIKVMVSRIQDDVSTGSRAEAVLEKGNEVGGSLLGSNQVHAQTYNCLKQSLVLNIAMTTARLYDQGTKRYHPNHRQLASIPLLVRLLRQKRCREHLVEEAYLTWMPHDTPDELREKCKQNASEAIDKVIDIYRQEIASPRRRHCRKLLKQFRDTEMAHTKLEEYQLLRPTYSQLFQLLSAARGILEAAKFAVSGQPLYLEDMKSGIELNSRDFWNKALA